MKLPRFVERKAVRVSVITIPIQYIVGVKRLIIPEPSTLPLCGNSPHPLVMHQLLVCTTCNYNSFLY
eukprot:c14270_g1_i1 orf=139-339(-)